MYMLRYSQVDTTRRLCLHICVCVCGEGNNSGFPCKQFTNQPPRAFNPHRHIPQGLAAHTADHNRTTKSLNKNLLKQYIYNAFFSTNKLPVMHRGCNGSKSVRLLLLYTLIKY